MNILKVKPKEYQEEAISVEDAFFALDYENKNIPTWLIDAIADQKVVFYDAPKRITISDRGELSILSDSDFIIRDKAGRILSCSGFLFHKRYEVIQ